MKAIVFDKKATPSSLVLREVAKPTPAENEVLVKIIAVSINAADYRSMQMSVKAKNDIFGADVAGVVEALGAGVNNLKLGDAVAGDISGCGFGGFAEYVAVPEGLLTVKPDAISFVDAAALPIAGVTALQALRKGWLAAGERVLVYGAGGGVGGFAVQLARHMGAQVSAVCSGSNVERVKALGASRVFDYAVEDVFNSNQKFNLIIAVNGKQPLRAYRGLLAAGGRCVVVGGSLSQVFNTMLFGGIMSLGGKKLTMLAAKSSPKDLAYLLSLVEQGSIKPEIERCYPLEDTAAAVEYMKKGHARGKVVINVVGQ